MTSIDRLGFLTSHLLSRKQACRVATTANISLEGIQVIDGVTVETDDRVLVKDQTNPIFNGIYLAKSGAWELAVDFDQRGHVVKGTRIFVTDGTTNALTEWYVTTTGRPAPGREAISFASLSMILSANLSAISALTPTDGNIIVGDGASWVAESGNTARTSLGVGTAQSPQFGGVNIGHASDTTITRPSSGEIAVAGNQIYRAGGTDIPVADGGTGRSSATAYAIICGGNTATDPHQSAGIGATGEVLTSNGPGTLPTFQGNTATLASGSLSGTAVTITNIPATYAYLILHITSGSSDTGARIPLVQVSTNGGASYDSTAGNYAGDYWSGSSTLDTTLASLVEAGSLAASNTFTCTIVIFNYHAGSHTFSEFRYVDTVPNARRGRVWYTGSTNAINALQILWNGTGSFDGGAYSLIGVK